MFVGTNVFNSSGMIFYDMFVTAYKSSHLWIHFVCV